MAKREYLKMLDYGEWLNSLLNENINQWEILDLINNSAKLLNIDYELKKESYFIQLIEKTSPKENEKLPDRIFRLYEDLSEYLFQLIQKILTAKTEFEKESPDINEIIEIESLIFDLHKKIPWDELPEINFESSEPTGEDKEFLEIVRDSSFFSSVTRKWGKKGDKNQYKLNEKTYDFFRLSGPISNVISFFKARETISLLTEFINKKNMPWYLAIPKACKELTSKKFLSPERIIEAYNQLADHFFIKGGVLTKERTILGICFPGGFSVQNSDKDYSDVPTDALLSNIFFDFLLLGGQDYYGFCNYCDEFFVVQRKGKKKYCSDVCRALAFKEKKSQ